MGLPPQIKNIRKGLRGSSEKQFFRAGHPQKIYERIFFGYTTSMQGRRLIRKPQIEDIFTVQYLDGSVFSQNCVIKGKGMFIVKFLPPYIVERL
jgi:hypothetical protein